MNSLTKAVMWLFAAIIAVILVLIILFTQEHQDAMFGLLALAWLFADESLKTLKAPD